MPSKVREFLYTNIIGSDKTLIYISYWSIIHFISGILTWIIVSDYFNGFLVHTIWEMWQKIIGMTVWNFRGVVDTLMDTVLFMIGMVMAAAWGRMMPGGKIGFI
jgi:hypothetical protein